MREGNVKLKYLQKSKPIIRKLSAIVIFKRRRTNIRPCGKIATDYRFQMSEK